MQRLNGRVEILRYLGIRSRTTLRKWCALGLPIHRTPTGRVFALCAEVDGWRRPPGLRRGIKQERPRSQTRANLSDFIRCKVDARTTGKTGRG